MEVGKKRRVLARCFTIDKYGYSIGLEAGGKRLAGHTARDATSDEVEELKARVGAVNFTNTNGSFVALCPRLASIGS
jgi:hypothetical protein